MTHAGCPTVDGEYEILTDRFNGPVIRERRNGLWYFTDGKIDFNTYDSIIRCYKTHEPFYKEINSPIEERVVVEIRGSLFKAYKYDDTFVVLGNKPILRENLPMVDRASCLRRGYKWPW